MRDTPKPGEWISVEYPVHNRADVPLEYADRTFLVLAVRDLRREPIAADSIAQRPFLRRGRWLLTVWDDDHGEERQVYVEPMRVNGETLPIPAFRLGVVGANPLSPWFVGPSFSDSPDDRQRLANTLRRLALTHGTSDLRAYPTRAK